MRHEVYQVSCRKDMTDGEYLESLEHLARAAHQLVAVGIEKERAANGPDMQALFAGAGNLNVALSYARAMAEGGMPQIATQPGGPFPGGGHKM